MAKTIGFWFRRKYNLPPTDPRYTSLTALELQAEYWAHYYAENKVTDEVEDDDFDPDQERARIEAEAEAQEAAEALLAAADDSEWEEVNLDGE